MSFAFSHDHQACSPRCVMMRRERKISNMTASKSWSLAVAKVVIMSRDKSSTSAERVAQCKKKIVLYRKKNIEVEKKTQSEESKWTGNEREETRENDEISAGSAWAFLWFFFFTSDDSTIFSIKYWQRRCFHVMKQFCLRFSFFLTNHIHAMKQFLCSISFNAHRTTLVGLTHELWLPRNLFFVLEPPPQLLSLL